MWSVVLDVDKEKWRKKELGEETFSQRKDWLNHNLTFKTAAKCKRGKPKLKSESGGL